MARTTVRVHNSMAAGNTAAVVGIVAVVSMTLAFILALVAMVVVALLIFGTLALLAGVTYAGMRYAMYRADAEASLQLIRHQLRLDVAKADSPELRAALQASLDDVSGNVSPKVALAMRRLNRAPMIGGARPAGFGVPRPTVTWSQR